MFYCDGCALENKWTISSTHTLHHCEVCGKPADCTHTPAKELPLKPKDDSFATELNPREFANTWLMKNMLGIISEVMPTPSEGYTSESMALSDVRRVCRELKMQQGRVTSLLGSVKDLEQREVAWQTMKDGLFEAAKEKPKMLYRHYKGGLYRVLHGTAEDASNDHYKEDYVVYQAVDSGKIYIRAFDEFWNDTVEHEGQTVPRFARHDGVKEEAKSKGPCKVHLAQDVEGALRNIHTPEMRGVWKHDDGRPMTTEEAEAEFLEHRTKGHKVIPLCSLSECPDFDYSGKGCPGHPQSALASIEEKAPSEPLFQCSCPPDGKCVGHDAEEQTLYRESERA